MARFKAKTIDLDLELTTLSGETVEIAGPDKVSGSEAGRLSERMSDQDKDFDKLPEEDRTPFAVGRHYARQLADFYGEAEHPKEWWMDNFDLSTLKDIKLHIARTLMGVERQGSSSGK